MIKGINKKKLGETLRSLREARGLTQYEVSMAINLATETLRRIENGHNIPSIQTLELLSTAYKINIMKAISSLSELNKYSKFYDELDKLIINYSVLQLSRIRREFSSYIKKCDEEYFDQVELKQFYLMLEGLEKYYNDKSTLEESTKCFVQSIQLRHSDFTIKQYKNHLYLPIELKSLYLIALNYCDRKEYEISNEILIYLMEEQLNKISLEDSLNQFKLLVKGYLNISYNYHCLDDFSQSLYYAELGIEKCINSNSFYLLYALYYRKAIAMMMRKEEKSKYLLFFERSIMLLEMQESYSLANIYRQVTKDKYNIIL